MSESQSAGLETLLVGLDGACLPVLEPLLEDGNLPALARVFEDGCVGQLESQMPPWTPSAWPSLYTGVNPGKHGVFDFLTFDGYDWDVVNRTHVREHALWELLDRHDVSSVVVNVPVTAPPRAFDGALIPGYVGPEDPDCHPEGLLADVREAVGDYRVYSPRDLSDEERIDWYRRLTRMRGEAFRYLAGRFDPEFGFLQFQQTDTVFHEMPENRDAVRAVFETVDEEVGRVLDDCDPDTVIVASDHGIGSYDEYEFRVNEFLRDRGYLTTTRGDGGMPSWASISRNRLRAEDGDDSPGTAERALALAARVGVTSQRLNVLLSRLGLKEFVLRHVSSDTVRAASERVDFAASTAYMRSRTELGVRLNLAGRDPGGTVSPAEYDSVRDDVMADLREARTPDGDPVFDAVVPREEWFQGPYAEDAVDVVTVPAGFDTYLSASLRGATFGPPSEPWNHKLHGVVAASGAGITDDPPDGAHLFDVAPTVLSTLGVPPSDRMDGDPLPFVDGVAPAEYAPFEYREAEPTDDAAVERHLADLGYLDGDR